MHRLPNVRPVKLAVEALALPFAAVVLAASAFLVASPITVGADHDA
jgi:hypothetical protein